MNEISLKNLYIAQAKKVAKETNCIVNRSSEDLLIIKDGNVIVKLDFRLNIDYYLACEYETNKQIIDKMYFDLLYNTLYNISDSIIKEEIRKIDRCITDDYVKNTKLLKDAYFGKVFEKTAKMYFV